MRPAFGCIASRMIGKSHGSTCDGQKWMELSRTALDIDLCAEGLRGLSVLEWIKI